MYHRRCKVDPLWNSVLVAGFHKGEGYVSFLLIAFTLALVIGWVRMLP